MHVYNFLKNIKASNKLLVLAVIICSCVIGFLMMYPTEYDSMLIAKNPSATQEKLRVDCNSLDQQVTPKQFFQSFFTMMNDSSWLARPAQYSPSFEQLHSLLFGSKAPNLYDTWPNYFKKKFDPTYPHTSLTQSLFTKIHGDMNIPVTFVVEVGSFMGKSATNIGNALRNHRSGVKPVLLCIDTWLGGLEHWVDDDLRQMMGMAYGRPIVYEQFIANIIANNLTEYIIPYSTTSILGARFLLEKKFFPQIVYLDSAHLQGETYVELELYWLLVQSGGILIGDDWGWPSVREDVLRFTQSSKFNVSVIGNTWYIKK